MQILGSISEKCHISFTWNEQTSKEFHFLKHNLRTLYHCFVINLDISLSFEISSHYSVLNAVCIATGITYRPPAKSALMNFWHFPVFIACEPALTKVGPLVIVSVRTISGHRRSSHTQGDLMEIITSQYYLQRLDFFSTCGAMCVGHKQSG